MNPKARGRGVENACVCERERKKKKKKTEKEREGGRKKEECRLGEGWL